MKPPPPKPGRRLIDHGKSECRGDRRVDGIAAAFEDLHSRFARKLTVGDHQTGIGLKRAAAYVGSEEYENCQEAEK